MRRLPAVFGFAVSFFALGGLTASSLWAQPGGTTRLPAQPNSPPTAQPNSQPAAKPPAPPAVSPGGRTISSAPQNAPPTGQQTQQQAARPRTDLPPGNPANQPAIVVPPRPKAPVAPFQLTEAEQKQVDETLKHWEERNNKIDTFKCRFTRFEYDKEMAPNDVELAKLDYQVSWAQGQLKYKRKTNEGMFKVTEMKVYSEASKKMEPAKDNLENWVCTGTEIHEFDATKEPKEHLVHPIPKEMQGEAIADGPVPFIFGAKVEKLKARYWIRDITPKDELKQRIWLEVYPQHQHDAANYRRAMVVLNRKDCELFALQIELPGGKQMTTFKFDEIVINDPLSIFKGDFQAPRTPRGWKRIVDPPPAVDLPAVQLQPSGKGDSREANRPGVAPQRR